MNTMYTIRLAKFGKMFIRASDNLCTDNKAAAVLFDSFDDANDFIPNWRASSKVNDAMKLDLEIVEVTVKPTIQKLGKVFTTTL